MEADQGRMPFDQGVVRLLTTHLAAIFWTADSTLTITTLGGGGLTAFGVKPEDGVGTTLFEYFQTRDPAFPAIAAHLGALEGRPGDYEVEYRGRTFYSRVEPFRGEDGRIVGVIGLGLDMTETVRARKELQESEDRFRSVFERSPVGIGIVLQGILRYANPALLRLFRCDDPSDLVGKSVLTHVAPAHRDQVRRRMEDREKGRPWGDSFETVALRKDGSEFAYHVDVARIRLPGGEATLAFSTDVTERNLAQEAVEKAREGLERRVEERTAELANANRELERAVERSERAYRDLQATQSQLVRSEKLASIGMLVSGVAHEINNPLNVIYGNLKLLEERALPAPKRAKGRAARGKRPAARPIGTRKTRSMLGDALRAAQRARDIIQTFRDFARDTRLAEEADLGECLARTVAVLERQLPEGISIVRQLKPIPKVRCFPGQMTQVFLNLLQNAVESIEGKGRIVLRTRKEDGHVLIEVEDSGRGMSDEVKGRLFEPFFTTKEVGRGLGLGLAVSAMIVHNHGGEIRVETAPGKGSLFQIRIPFRNPAPRP
jgi:PAS domain S-box-containing protein